MFGLVSGNAHLLNLTSTIKKPKTNAKEIGCVIWPVHLTPVQFHMQHMRQCNVQVVQINHKLKHTNMEKKILFFGLLSVLFGCFLFINDYRTTGQILIIIGTLLEFIFIYLFIKRYMAK